MYALYKLLVSSLGSLVFYLCNAIPPFCVLTISSHLYIESEDGKEEEENVQSKLKINKFFRNTTLSLS